MRIGATVPPAYGDTAPNRAPSFTETLAYGRTAEAVGLDSIWVFDHLIFRFPDEPEEGSRRRQPRSNGSARHAASISRDAPPRMRT